METPSSNTGVTLGKIIAGAFLHEFREDGKSGTQMLQLVAGKLRKFIGVDQTKAVFEGSEKMHTALVSACIDYAISEKLTDESQKLIAELEDAERIMTEMIFLHVTGRSPIKKDRNDGFWIPPLWRFKNTAALYLELSPSGVKKEELEKAMKEILLSALNEVRAHLIKSL